MTAPPERAAYEPTSSQKLLLQAGLHRDGRGIRAWERWKTHNDLVETHHDVGSFRLLPLVCLNLVELGYEDAWMPRLRGIYRYFWSSNQHLFHESSELLGRFQRAGIKTLVLKGAAVSPQYYRSPAVRPMSDVDVLVPEGAVPAALDCLATAGWQPRSRRVLDDLRFRHAVQMVNPRDQEFDLHWHAFGECLQPGSDAGVWDRARRIEIGHAQTCAMGPADALLHTVVHGVYVNRMAPIRWIADAVTILSADHPSVDWDVLVQEAERRQVLLRMQAGLRYLRDEFAVSVPEGVLTAGRHSLMERFEFRYMTIRREERKELFFDSLPVLVSEYLRFASGRHALDRLTQLPHFIRYHLRLKGRLQIPVVVLRSVANKLRELLAPPALTNDRA